MTYYEAAKIVLEKSDIPMRVDEIWNKAKALELDKEIEKTLNGKMSKTPEHSIGSRIYKDIKYNPTNTIFIKTDKFTFFLKNKNIKPVKQPPAPVVKILESDLHAPLTKFLSTMKIYAKTINAGAVTAAKGKMKWGTPDIVAVTFKDYINQPIIELFNHINLPTTQIYAYELKLELRLDNLVQHYFQALSNSGWANEAWLVAKDIDTNNEELEEEIKRLNQSFGVGIIHLDYDNPEDSNILIPARKRAYLDIDTMNKLCENNQFKEFIQYVNQILATQPISRETIIAGMIKNNKLNNPN